MIVINKDSVNACVFTLNEKTTLDPVFYLIVIHSNQTKEDKVMYLGVDQSLNINRWNEFNITEDVIGNEDLTNQIINLVPGTYDYYVWQSTTDNVDLTGAVSIVESGKLRVIGESAVIPTIDLPTTKYVFE